MTHSESNTAAIKSQFFQDINNFNFYAITYLGNNPGLMGMKGDRGFSGKAGSPGVGTPGANGEPGRPGVPGRKGESGLVGRPGSAVSHLAQTHLN